MTALEFIALDEATPQLRAPGAGDTYVAPRAVNFIDTITGTYLTASQLLATDGSKAIVSLTTATYPSLTELSYVKGVTSAIQTQLNAKQASDAQLTSLAALSYASNALKVIRVNAGETDFELATISGISDGDKGDITVSSSGTVWTIDNGVVTLAKMADIATDRLIGRDTAGTGVPEALTVGGGVEFTGSGGIQTSAFTGDVTKTAGGTALTIAANAVTDAKFRQSAGLSVVGRSANSTGNVADITAANDAEVLRRSGTSIGFGTVATAGIADNAVTYAKIQDVSATSRVLGRRTAGSGDTEECTLTQVLDFVGSAAQGDILYRGASDWTRLGAGTSGQFLQTQGAGANPQWATGSTSTPTLIATQSTASGASVAFTSIPQTYKTLFFEFLGVSHNDGSSQVINMEVSGSNGSTYTSGAACSNSLAAANTGYGGVSVPNYVNGAGTWSAAVTNATSAETQTAITTLRMVAWRIDAIGIDAVRFSPAAGSFDAGTINLYGL